MELKDFTEQEQKQIEKGLSTAEISDKEATDKMEKNAVLENVPAVKNKKIMTISYDELMDYGPSVIDSLEKVNDFVNK